MKTITAQNVNNALTTGYNEPTSREREPFATLNVALSIYDVTYEGNVTIINKETQAIYNIDPGLLIIDAILAVQHPTAEKREAAIAKFPRGIARNLFWADMATTPDKDAPGVVHTYSSKAEQYRLQHTTVPDISNLLTILDDIANSTKAVNIKEKIAALKDSIFPAEHAAEYVRLYSLEDEERKERAELAAITGPLAAKYGMTFGRAVKVIHKDRPAYAGVLSKDNFLKHQSSLMTDLILEDFNPRSNGDMEVIFNLKS